MKQILVVFLVFFGVILMPAPSFGADPHQLTGGASWYGEDFHGRPTASGQPYDMHQLTAAHKTLPFGTRVLVTDLNNGRSVEVTITDRGPFVEGRVIDLSYRAAQELDLVHRGVTRVLLEPLGGPEAPPAFAVQVASYQSRHRAAQVISSLSTHADLKPLALVPVIAEASGLFRVLVPLDAKEQAEAVIAAAAGLGFSDAFLRQLQPSESPEGE